jgi:hypothetical protein
MGYRTRFILWPGLTPLTGKIIFLQTLKVGANDRFAQELQNLL